MLIGMNLDAYIFGQVSQFSEINILHKWQIKSNFLSILKFLPITDFYRRFAWKISNIM